MIRGVLEKLDRWIEEKNRQALDEGMLRLSACEIKVIGQAALLEAKLNIHLPATVDVDVFANYENAIRKKFDELLREVGKELDPVGHEAWMPDETEYKTFYTGKWVKGYLAKPEFIMISKAKKAPIKNKNIIADYIASEPPLIFFDLAKKYEIDLEYFLD